MTEDEPFDEEALRARLDARLAEWRAEDAVKRKRLPERLTKSVLDSTPDDELEDLIIEFIASKWPDDATDGYEWLEVWPITLQLVWASIVVEGEIGNGGFNQLFFNSTRALAPLAVSGFAAFGADRQAAIVAQAIARLESDSETIVTSWGDGSLESFLASYSEAAFADLDDQFAEAEEANSSSARRARFIWAHVHELDSG